MSIQTAALLALLIIFASSQALTVNQQLPVSNCLGNCYGCQPQDPYTCITTLNPSTNHEMRCSPYYNGNNCTIGGSYYNVYQQNGRIDNFANWSLPSQPPRQQCQSLNGGGTFTAIGPFSSTLNATKLLQFSAVQGVNKLLVKISVGVSDAQISQSSGNSSQSVQTVEINGSLFIVTTNTAQNQNVTSGTIPFVTMEARNIMRNNAIIKTVSTGHNSASPVETRCGFVYQYEFFLDAGSGSIFEQLNLNFFLPVGSGTLWWLFDFSVEAGCSGFSVGTFCDTCLTGFYPVTTLAGYPNGCQHCDKACATCGSGGVCLSCQNYAVIDSITGKCAFPTYFSIFNSSWQYQLISGESINVTSQFFSNIYRSQGRQITLGYTLTNTQGYFLKFYILFPSSYADNNAALAVTIDGQTWNINYLDKNRGFLSDINGGAGRLYALPFSIDRMQTKVNRTSEISIRVISSSIAVQFYITDIVIVQYQCSSNCLDCGFSLTQNTVCSQCNPFYERQTNCVFCANGYYELADPLHRCVKCYSNCKQCRGSGQYDCTTCFNKFQLTDLTFNSFCIDKIVSDFKKVPNYIVCSSAPSQTALLANPNCSTCLNSGSNIYRDPNCIQCWLAFNYAYGRCGAIRSSGLSFYASQAILGQNSSGWVGSGVTTYSCTTDYIDLIGIPNVPNNTNSTTPVPTTLASTFNNLPSHFGINFVLTIFKVDYWGFVPGANLSNINRLTPLNLTVRVSSPATVDVTYTVRLDNSYGANICGETDNEMMFTLPAEIPDHSSSQVTITIEAPDRGVFVRDLELYLGNCQACSKVGLSYELFFIPVYSDSTSVQTGVNVYLTFNKPINFVNATQHTVEAFANSFTFQVDGVAVPSTVFDMMRLNDPNHRYIGYFLPLNASLINSTVTARTSQPNLVFTQEGNVRRQLVTSSISYQMERYVNASPDTRRSISQLSDFFKIITWITLITMIVAVGFGIGVFFEQFSQMMGLIFYHVYITSWLLPPTIKVPLANAQRMEHLNYFGSDSVENNLFGLDPIIGSNFIFLQFNIDVYFLRSIYPILIINAIFIGWFIILKLLMFTQGFSNSPNKIIRFFRSIPTRPLAFFDQIWRYQYLPVVWACMIQFTNFSGPVINLIICVLAFVIAVLWPVVITVYIYRKHFTTNAKHFLFLYHDMMYLKTSSLCDNPKSYLYIGFRTGKLLAYAVFIALFVNNSIIGPVLLIFYNLIDSAIAVFLKIYHSSFYLLTRIIENVLLIISAILIMIIFGFADKNDFNAERFQNLGYGLSTVFVLMIINGIVRFLYLLFRKYKEWSVGTYDVGEHGELVDYYAKTPVPGKEPISQE